MIINSLVNGFDYTLLCIEKDEVETINPRDSENDVIIKKKELDSEYSYDEEEKRINNILKTDDLSVNQDNLNKYYNYLKKNFKPPCILNGMEDFDWEEPHILGGWSKNEYERLKKQTLSYTDKFEFLNLIEEYNDRKGIYANVMRLSDQKLFNIPRWDLKVVDKRNSNSLLISDFSSWMTNY